VHTNFSCSDDPPVADAKVPSNISGGAPVLTLVGA